MFSYKKIKNYQKDSFASILYEVNSKFSKSKNSYNELLTENSSGCFFTLKNNQSLSQINSIFISNLIIENILLLGDAVNEGHYFFIAKDFNLKTSPQIIFKDANSKEEPNDLQLKIDKTNILEHKDKLEKFLICALNIDPFIYITPSSKEENEFIYSFFINNLKITDEFTKNFQLTLLEKFSIESETSRKKINSFLETTINLLKDNSQIQSFIDLNIQFNFKKFIYSLSDTLNKNIQNYNTSDNFQVYDPNIEQNYSDLPYSLNSFYLDDKDNCPLNLNEHYTTTNIFTENFLELSKFTMNYSPSYLLQHINIAKEMFLEKLFTTSFKNSNIFDIQHNSNFDQNIVFHIKSLYKIINENYPHFLEKYNQFIINISPSLKDKLRLLLQNNETEIFNKDTQTKLEQAVLHQLTPSGSESLGNILDTSIHGKAELKLISSMLSNLDIKINTEIINNEYVLTVPVYYFFINAESKYFSYPLHQLHKNIQEKQNFSYYVDKDNQNFILKIPLSIKPQEHEYIINNIKDIFFSYREEGTQSVITNKNHELFLVINSYIRETILQDELNNLHQNSTTKSKHKI